MVSLICIGCEYTSCSLEPNLDYQYVHHQVLRQSNGNICHCYIKLMDSRVISTLDLWRCAWYSALNNTDVSTKLELFLYSSSIEEMSKNVLMDPNIIHLIGESFDIHGASRQ